MIDRDRLLYTSGFFDAHGTVSFSVDNSGSFVPAIQTTSRVFNALDYCWTTFGLGGISEIRPKVYSWYVTSQGDILFVLEHMFPYLISKHREAAWMIEYLRSRREERIHSAPYSPRELELIIRVCEKKSRRKETNATKLAREKMREFYDW